jgi:hydroxylamine reductase (hybrid-cluster protein)
MADQEGVRPVACGYGLLGLCCDSCLRGPCRRSPFDDAINGRSCREDSDWIVANNLMERVALKSKKGQ